MMNSVSDISEGIYLQLIDMLALMCSVHMCMFYVYLLLTVCVASE